METFGRKHWTMKKYPDHKETYLRISHIYIYIILDILESLFKPLLRKYRCLVTLRVGWCFFWCFPRSRVECGDCCFPLRECSIFIWWDLLEGGVLRSQIIENIMKNKYDISMICSFVVKVIPDWETCVFLLYLGWSHFRLASLSLCWVDDFKFFVACNSEEIQPQLVARVPNHQQNHRIFYQKWCKIRRYDTS